MEILRGMEVKITGVIHRLIFKKKKNIFFFIFFFEGGGGIFVQIIGPRAPLSLRPCSLFLSLSAGHTLQSFMRLLSLNIMIWCKSLLSMF